MRLKSENTSRISAVPKASRNRMESRTVVEVGKAGIGGSLRQSLKVSRRPTGFQVVVTEADVPCVGRCPPAPEGEGGRAARLPGSDEGEADEGQGSNASDDRGNGEPVR